ncbi:Septum formation protein Maf [Roseovarius albus]|uniref:Nucleoside triphosphate pyrophosphatase n=1 Tax=Roseovarius albus TaxID=1247867 RepID=A0A1X6Z576_9RHOB|nr:Maf family nucleotide pyrophosphatase [Roseovarius albus]SLN40630.1 Septum formation protein Maf [Roseovarius albus]
MSPSIILASSSQIRQSLLKNAGIAFDVILARVDEATIKRSLLSDGATPRDIADALAEHKARKISSKYPGSLVLGCDQVLCFENQLFSKPDNKNEMKEQLKVLRGKPHELLSAVVIYENTEPKWRHVGSVKLTMRTLSDRYIDQYVERNWKSAQYCVGGYKLEEEGSRLFAQIEGDYFHVLGLPLLEIMTYLIDRGDLDI